MTTAVKTMLRVRVLGVDVAAGTAHGHPLGEAYNAIPPHRLPNVVFRVDNPLDLVTNLAEGADARVEVAPMDILTWTRPPV